MIKWLDEYFEEVILIVLLAAMTLIMGVQVTARYVFHNSLSWSEEVVRFMFVWSGFLGIPYCIKHRSSIAVELFKLKLSEKGQDVLDYIIYAIMAVIAVIMLVYGWQVAATTFASGQTSPATGVPMYIVQGSVAFSAFLAVIRVIQCFFNHAQYKEERKNADVLDDLIS